MPPCSRLGTPGHHDGSRGCLKASRGSFSASPGPGLDGIEETGPKGESAHETDLKNEGASPDDTKLTTKECVEHDYSLRE